MVTETGEEAGEPLLADRVVATAQVQEERPATEASEARPSANERHANPIKETGSPRLARRLAAS